MIATADHSLRRRGRARIAAAPHMRPVRVVLVAVLVSALLALPAEAKRKRKRSFYAPPQASMVVDGYSGKVIHQSNPDEPRYPASITKVMTLYLLFEQMKAGKLKLNSELKVSAFAAAQSPSKLGLQPGSTITVRDAIYALVTKSANDCAVVVAENLAGSEDDFARAMTTKARTLGMTNTTFRNASGLPNSEQRTTARDLITLGRRVLLDFPDYAPVFRTRSFTYQGESYRNHNGLLFTYEGTEGLKTGFTLASGFNLLTSVRRDKRHLLAVVLGGRSAVERNSRMRSLLNAAWSKAADGTKTKMAPPPPAPVAEDALVASATRPGSSDHDIPERNPAFHPTNSERAMTVAMTAMLEMERKQAEATQVAAVGGAASGGTTAIALAAGPSSGAGAVAVAEEEVAREEMVSAAEEMSDEGQAGQEEGDTTAEAPPAATAAVAAPATPVPTLGPYHIQVGSYASQLGAQTWLEKVAAGKAKTIVNGHGTLTVQGEVGGQPRYRARFGQFSEVEAKNACGKMKALSIDCMVVRAE
jgi:D-alanyl-D-alanine carboxypeptidase